MLALLTSGLAIQNQAPTVCSFWDGDIEHLTTGGFSTTRAVQHKLKKGTMFSAEDKSLYDLTGTTYRMSYGGAWLGDNLVCEAGKFSGHIWEFAYMLHKLTNATILGAPATGWGNAGNRGNPDKHPFAHADGGDDIILAWKDGPTPDRNQYYTNMVTVSGGGVAPSNYNSSVRHTIFMRPEDRAKFAQVLSDAVMDPNDQYAASRVLTTTPIEFADGTRIAKLCSCPCATMNYLLYDPTSNLDVSVNDHYFFGGVTPGSPELHHTYAYDAQWFDGVLRGVCDYTVVREDFEHQMAIPEYDFTADAPTGSGKTYADLLGHISPDEYGRNSYIPIESDGMYVAKDTPNHDKLVLALKKLVNMGVYDLIQTKWDEYANKELGVVSGMCTEIDCKNLTKAPENDTPITDSTFSWCVAQTYISTS
jgi:hypothetical protein